jgi:3-methyladenine DNA glycosylase AlkD
MAYLAAHDKQAPDAEFLRLLPILKRHSSDERNFVKKAINWALRQIGKRNRRLNRAAVHTARQIRAIDSRAARWVAADALRELLSPAVKRRLQGR